MVRCLWISGVVGIALALVPVNLAQAGLVNGDFKDYGVLGLPTALDSLPYHGWKETGAGNVNLVYSGFGAYTAMDNGVLLTTVGEGIFQTFSGTVAGQEYFIEGAYGQVSQDDRPTIRTSVFDGNSLVGSLLKTYTYQLDADVYGDGNVSSTYIGAFTAAGPVSTILITLEARSSQSDAGAVIDLIIIDAAAVPEPSSAALACVGVALGLAWARRQRFPG